MQAEKPPEPRLFLTLGLVQFPRTVTRAGTVTHWAGKPWRQARPGWLHAPFLFLYFSKTFFTEIYFQYHNLQFCTPTARQGGGRGPAAQQRGGRDLYVNLKKKLFAREPLAGACRPPGGRQAPHSCIKGFPSPSPSFASHDIQRAGGREEGWGREL